MGHVVIAALLLALATPALAANAANAATPSAPASVEAPALARKLDINRATAADLVSVPGIGERLAQAIVELRGRKGSFTSLDELLEVRGIGEKSLALLSAHLSVVQTAQQPPSGKVPAAK